MDQVAGCSVSAFGVRSMCTHSSPGAADAGAVASIILRSRRDLGGQDDSKRSIDAAHAARRWQTPPSAHSSLKSNAPSASRLARRLNE